MGAMQTPQSNRVQQKLHCVRRISIVGLPSALCNVVRLSCRDVVHYCLAKLKINSASLFQVRAFFRDGPPEVFSTQTATSENGTASEISKVFSRNVRFEHVS